jgi:hypothetical protein
MNIQNRLLISLLTAFITGGTLHFTRPPIKNSQMQEDWFWAKKTHDTAELDMIFYGDSRINQGIDPRKFTEYFPNHTIANLGYPNAGYNEVMFNHLKDILKGKEDNAILVLGITPHSLTELAMGNDSFLTEISRPHDIVKTRLHWYPWLNFFEPIRPSQFSKANKDEGFYATYHPSGWKQAYRIPADPGIWLPKYKTFFHQAQVSEFRVAALYDFIQEMKASGVTVVGFRFPSTRQMEEVEDNRSGFDEALFSKGFLDAGGYWIPIKNRFDYFSYDGSHLHYKAARSFSGHLAKKLDILLNGK